MKNDYFKINGNDLLLSIKLVPRSKKLGVLGVLGDALKIGVNSPPVDNKANEDLIDYLSKLLKIPKSKISIIKGLTSKNKTILIRQADPSLIDTLENLL